MLKKKLQAYLYKTKNKLVYRRINVKKLFKAIALITFFSILTRAAGFLFRIYLSRTLDTETFGIYQVALSFFVVLLTFVASGLPLIISRNTAKYSALKQYKKQHELVSSSLLISLILGLALSVFVILFKGLFSKLFAEPATYNLLLILLPAVVLTGLFGVFRGWLWGKNNYFAVCFSEFIEQVVRIIICVVLIGSNVFLMDGSTAAALSLTISCVISLIIIIFFYFGGGGKLTKPKNTFSEVIRPSSPITFVRVLTSLTQPLIAIIIPARLIATGFTKSQALSIFGVAIGMTMPLLFIPSTLIGSLSMALIPELSTAVTKQDDKHVNNSIATSLLFTMFVSSLFVPLYMGAGEEIGLFFYDNALSGGLLVSSAWVMIPFGLTSISASILNALGLEIKSMRNYIIGAIVLLACLWFLPQYIKINALIWGMGLCMITSCALNIRMIKKKTSQNLNFLKPFLLMLAIILPVAALSNFIVKILINYFNLFFSLLISCGVGGVSFILICMVFNIIDLKSFLITFSKRKNNKKDNIKKTKPTKRRWFPSFMFFRIKKRRTRTIKLYPSK
jgi:stage V sporulation protein B